MKKKALALAMMVGLSALMIGGCSKPADDSSAAGTATAGTTGAAATAGTTGTAATAGTAGTATAGTSTSG